METSVITKSADKKPYKLKPQHKELIFQYFAVNETATNIVKILQTKYSISVGITAVCYYRDRYPERIVEYQESLKRDFTVIPSANKYWRIYTRHKLILDLLDHLWCEVPIHNKKTGAIIYDDDGEIVYQRLLKGNHSVINQLLDSQAKELEEMGLEDEAKTDLFKRLLDRGDVAINFIMDNSGNGNGRNGK